ncbi:PD-(D/E)XK nuclease family protein [Campylobacter concisus]|uniref:PDDEXK-like family protein n=1 Tax=Campylobacter concisus TaxID=199 RepID=UPI0011E78EB3|nr:PD-(D/E)XK nuclease family protein [Campylobacter concisus]
MEIKSKKEHFKKLFADMSKGYMAAKSQADRQRAMGKHDYNIFTLFHGFSDEVNLHSNFIASLLDPNGDHYKSDLFLKLFLETCGIDDFGIDTSRATVFKEFKHIDIYISDGKKHIILENKVYAKDQPTQIARYIKAIQNEGAKESDRVKDEDIYVLYLHPDGELPDKQSFGDYYAKLLGENPSIKFKVISYGKEILEWIDRCKNEVSNITDLNIFLSQYKDVIEMIYNRYKRIDKMETANLVEIFKENYTAVSEIANKYQETRKKIIDEFFKNVKDILENDLKDKYSIELNSVAYRPIVIKNTTSQDKKWKNFYFTVEFQKSSTYSMPYVGFRRVDDNIDDEKLENPFKQQLPNQTKYFLAYSDKIFKEDICENIIKDKLSPEDFAGIIKGILEQFEKYNLVERKQN